jgi:phage-related tail protein
VVYEAETDVQLQDWLAQADSRLAEHRARLESAHARQAEARGNISQQLEKRNTLHGALGTVEAQIVEQVGCTVAFVQYGVEFRVLY